MNGEIEVVKIDPDLWGCAPAQIAGSLLHRNGKMCCLGFAALQFGLKAKDILGESMPNDVTEDGHGMDGQAPFDERGANDDLLGILAKINDGGITPDEKTMWRELSMPERVEKINATLAAAGATFRFELEVK